MGYYTNFTLTCSDEVPPSVIAEVNDPDGYLTQIPEGF